MQTRQECERVERTRAPRERLPLELVFLALLLVVGLLQLKIGRANEQAPPPAREHAR